jgi:hypothetical protein
MTDPQRLQDDASHIVLYCWIATYLRANDSALSEGASSEGASSANLDRFSEQFQAQAIRLRESALLLQAALDKMRLANERLAARMAEHKAFFAKYQAPQ